MSYLSAKERLSLLAVGVAEHVLPAASRRRRNRNQQRDRLDAVLRRLTDDSRACYDGTVLIDGTWYNPNYWVRFTLLRAALGLHQSREVAYFGAYRQSEIARSCANLGIGETCSFDRFPVDESAVERQCNALLRSTRNAADILEWELPGGFPASFLYDAILRQQRLPAVNVDGDRFEDLVRFGLRGLVAAEAMLDHYRPSLIVLSAVNNFRNAPMAWMAAKRGVSTVAVHGQFGVLRFYRVSEPEDIHGRFDRPTKAQIDSLDPARAAQLQEIGSDYLAERRAGRTSDMGAVKAYRERDTLIGRRALQGHFGWQEDKPVIAVYAANWYDFPHGGGMKNFRDFADWQILTAERAMADDSANWLFKPHPNEASYPGASLGDVLGTRVGGRLGIAEPDWNGAAVMSAVDGIVAVHGTVGIEAPALGTPVLLADRGWYHDCGFARWATSREDYIRQLSGTWWRDAEIEANRRRAQIFAGWFYGCPDWQGGFLLPEDTRKYDIYDELPNLIQAHGPRIERELATVRAWFDSGAQHYHTCKMAAAEGFVLSNVRP